ncbi:MAG: hypothetical protein Q7V63_01715 [Gammaproteobacteria bacterium]|nr:hypothetical protein [Gammaproteobacteria bacterium]
MLANDTLIIEDEDLLECSALLVIKDTYAPIINAIQAKALQFRSTIREDERFSLAQQINAELQKIRLGPQAERRAEIILRIREAASKLIYSKEPAAKEVFIKQIVDAVFKLKIDVPIVQPFYVDPELGLNHFMGDVQRGKVRINGQTLQQLFNEYNALHPSANLILFDHKTCNANRDLVCRVIAEKIGKETFDRLTAAYGQTLAKFIFDPILAAFTSKYNRLPHFHGDRLNIFVHPGASEDEIRAQVICHFTEFYDIEKERVAQLGSTVSATLFLQKDAGWVLKKVEIKGDCCEAFRSMYRGEEPELLWFPNDIGHKKYLLKRLVETFKELVFSLNGIESYYDCFDLRVEAGESQRIGLNFLLEDADLLNTIINRYEAALKSLSAAPKGPVNSQMGKILDFYTQIYPAIARYEWLRLVCMGRPIGEIRDSINAQIEFITLYFSRLHLIAGNAPALSQALTRIDAINSMLDSPDKCVIESKVLNSSLKSLVEVEGSRSSVAGSAFSRMSAFEIESIGSSAATTPLVLSHYYLPSVNRLRIKPPGLYDLAPVISSISGLTMVALYLKGAHEPSIADTNDYLITTMLAGWIDLISLMAGVLLLINERLSVEHSARRRNAGLLLAAGSLPGALLELVVVIICWLDGKGLSESTLLPMFNNDAYRPAIAVSAVITSACLLASIILCCKSMCKLESVPIQDQASAPYVALLNDSDGAYYQQDESRSP